MTLTKPNMTLTNNLKLWIEYTRFIPELVYKYNTYHIYWLIAKRCEYDNPLIKYLYSRLIFVFEQKLCSYFYLFIYKLFISAGVSTLQNVFTNLLQKKLAYIM